MKKGSFIRGKVGSTLVLVGFLCGQALADGLPIRVDTPRPAAVYIRGVDSGEAFRKLSDSTPATYQAAAGERIDIRATSQEGFFIRWEGNRQNVAGPANITIRLEKAVAWERVALVAGGGALLLIGLFVGYRRRTKMEVEVARSQIMSLTERAASAEKVGSVARTLGSYKVLGKLGAGAMGVVYKVENSGGDIFAAKVPNEMDDRVRREAEVSASLLSPNIVKFYGLEEGETSFLLMEFLDGETVHEWLATASAVSFEELDNLVTQLLDGLEVAHNQGVYHRDLKPENLFLCREGGKQILKIMDFGLAASVNAARLTRTGQAMGTPIYASPEQLQGDPVDCTTDLYSVGVFIFELATGKLPWKKTDPVALTLQKFKPLPDEPVVFRPDLPMEWNRLVVDLLQGDSSKRPQSVAEVRARWQSGRQGV